MERRRKDRTKDYRDRRTMNFGPTKYIVPDNWDMTQPELHPISWYITDAYVTWAINCMFSEEDLEDPSLFVQNFPNESKAFFHAPYSYSAWAYGYPRDSAKEQSFHPAFNTGKDDSVDQGYDTDDVILLHS